MATSPSAVLPKMFCSRAPFGFKKKSHNLQIYSVYDICPKLIICISELIFYVYYHVPVTHTTMNCIILP